jgi:N-acetylmuramoyl-L-alanine amidase
MPGIVLNGRQVEVPGVTIHNYLDDSFIKLASYDGCPRKTSWVRNITLHVTVGDAQTVIPGKGPSELWWHRYPDIWASDKDKNGNRIIHGAHAVIDGDTVVGWYADGVLIHAYQAGVVDNEYSIGIEVKQWGDKVYQASLDVVVPVLDNLTAELGIQRQFQWPYKKAIPRLADGHDFVGIAGHRDLTDTRGWGDPGDAIYVGLRNAGYESFDFSTGEDIAAWKKRQVDFNTRGAKLTVDGIPGPATWAAMKNLGYKDGMWVAR